LCPSADEIRPWAFALDAFAAQRLSAALPVLRNAARAWEHLQQMYDGQDQERRESGEIGSVHRDNFEAWIEALVDDAKSMIAEYDRAAAPDEAPGSGSGWGRGMFIAGASAGVTPKRKERQAGCDEDHREGA
jgi:hypothetical protein